MAVKAKPSSADSMPTTYAGTSAEVNPRNVTEAVYQPEKDLHAWRAPMRPFKTRGREYWVTIVSIASLLAFILFLAEGVMPVILIISLVFLYYVMSTVKPEEIDYRITNRGVRIADNLTEWDFLLRYWFESKMGSRLFVVETVNFPGRLEMVISEKGENKIKEVMTKYLPEEKPLETTVDKASSWVSGKLSGE